MKIMNNLKKYGEKIAVFAAAPFALAANTYAALPETAKQALEGAKADGLEAGWLVIGVFAALFVIAIVKRVMR